MKKILLIISALFTGLVSQAQTSACDVRNIAIQLKSVVQNGSSCDVIFDLSYEQQTNNGNKYAFIHIWNSGNYPDLAASGVYTPPSNNPVAADLVTAIATIVINNNTTPPVLMNTYAAEPTVPVLLTAGMGVSKVDAGGGWDRMTITNIPLTITNCGGASLIADVWGSQASDGQTVQCFSTNHSFIVGNPKISGILLCTVPRKYNMSIENVGAADIKVTYKVYVDNGDHIYEPNSETLAGDYPDTKTITPGSAYTVVNQGYDPYDGLKPYSDRGLWIEVTTEGFANKSIFYLNNLCAPLPVVYSSFTAARNGDKVDIRWTTATEINNAGFEIQRRVGSGNYEIIATVATKALLGNSTSEINYTYADNNPTHSVSVYRIRQFDIDARYTYSDERLVAGEGMNIHVFPNPVSGNNFHVVLENPQQVHDVAMFDSYGRVVQQWFSVTASELVVRKPSPGMYIIKVINKTTLQVETTRIIVMAQ